jgi:hypothetical protein
MNRQLGRVVLFQAVFICILAMFAVAHSSAQVDSTERSFPQSKAAVEKALNSMQSALSGRLPVLEGFANSEHPLERYQRGYYQATAQVNAAAAGGSLVRIKVKVTAWYSDPIASRSGYQLLTSNGRLEADLLDQLTEQLAKSSPEADKKPEVVGNAPSTVPPTRENAVMSAPGVSNADASNPGRFSTTQNLSAETRALAHPTESMAGKGDSQLRAEAENLQEILKNQAHPKNLVAVKKAGTAVVTAPSLNAKPLFLASMHDEFEMLDFNEDWVHVRISGLSRGWIWRNSVEMPEGIPDTTTPSGPPRSSAADLFHVTREENAIFPGDWEPLRGKSVRIISVQKVDENEGGPQEKLEYAKYLLEKSLADSTVKPLELTGIVLIFDSADGGMIAATLTALQQWKAGTLSDSALWHNCFFDPPETFHAAEPSGTH